MSAPDPSDDPSAAPPAPEPIPDVPSPRSLVGFVAGWLTVLLLPPLLAIAVLGSKFQGLRADVALEHAQVARNVAEGKGLVTDSIRPLSLSLRPSPERHPDLYHAPLHPLLLGAAFALFHPSDRLTAGLGLLFWALSVIFTFVLARRWFRPGVAGLAALLYGCNVVMIRSSLSGLPHPLSALALLGLAALLLPPARAEGESGGRGEFQLAGAGALCALAALGQYLLFFLAPVALVYVLATSRRKGRALFFFAFGFLLVLSPWIFRNFRWGRAPFFSLYWYETLAGTDLYPGDSVWRSLNALSTGPVEFAVLHPLQMLRKAIGGLLVFWQESLPTIDPVVGFLFAAAILGERLGDRERGVFRAAAAGLVACVLAAVFIRPDTSLLLAFSPLLAIAAAAQAASWMSEASGRLSLKSAWKIPAVTTIFRSTGRARGAMRFAGLAVVTAAVGFPLFHFLWITRVQPDALAPDMAVLRQQIPEGATVLSDKPASVAWYARRRAIGLFQEESTWDAIARGGVKIDAVYLTPALASMASPEGWWWWIASPRGIYRDLVPREPLPSRAILRVRGATR